MQKVFDKSIGQIIEDGIPAEIHQLRDYGIVVEDDAIYIANSHAMLKKQIYRGTRWESCWHNSLARLPGAEKNHQKKIGGKNTRCVKIPRSNLA